MKIFLRLPNGTRFYYHRYKREPMEDSRFYVLCGFLAAAMLFAFLVSSAVLR